MSQEQVKQTIEHYAEIIHGAMVAIKKATEELEGDNKKLGHGIHTQLHNMHVRLQKIERLDKRIEESERQEE